MTGLSLVDKATIGAALLGGSAGVVGAFAVLRRRSLVGDMLAHASLPGVCAAFLITGSRDLLSLSLGALASGLLAIGLMTVVTRWTRTKEDAAIGIMLSAFFGAGVVMLTMITRSARGGGSAGLSSYLFGEPGNMVDRDLMILGAVGLACLALIAALFKEFQVVAFDADFARSQGWPTLTLELTMMAAVAVVTIVGLPIVGVILMAAMIILPAATARLWTHRLGWLLLLAGALGAATGGLGVRLAGSLPAGPVIVLTGAAAFVASLLAAPQRGALAVLASETRLRFHVARDHLLRSLYELTETALPERRPVSLDRLADHRAMSPWMRRIVLAYCRGRGLVEQNAAGVALTPNGLRRANDATRTHRLWEIYMMEYAGAAPDHVDRSADDVEHLLPRELVAALEKKLARPDPAKFASGELPPSPHPVTEEAS